MCDICDHFGSSEKSSFGAVVAVVRCTFVWRMLCVALKQVWSSLPLVNMIRFIVNWTSTKEKLIQLLQNSRIVPNASSQSSEVWCDYYKNQYSVVQCRQCSTHWCSVGTKCDGFNTGWICLQMHCVSGCSLWPMWHVEKEYTNWNSAAPLVWLSLIEKRNLVNKKKQKQITANERKPQKFPIEFLCITVGSLLRPNMSHFVGLIVSMWCNHITITLRFGVRSSVEMKFVTMQWFNFRFQRNNAKEDVVKSENAQNGREIPNKYNEINWPTLDKPNAYRKCFVYMLA